MVMSHDYFPFPSPWQLQQLLPGQNCTRKVLIAPDWVLEWLINSLVLYLFCSSFPDPSSVCPCCPDIWSSSLQGTSLDRSPCPRGGSVPSEQIIFLLMQQLLLNGPGLHPHYFVYRHLGTMPCRTKTPRKQWGKRRARTIQQTISLHRAASALWTRVGNAELAVLFEQIFIWSESDPSALSRG